MADSIQDQIMDAIATAAATITTGNGYKTDIGNKVFEWKTKGWSTEAGEMPGISFKDPTDSIEWTKMRGNGAGVPGGIWEHTLRIEFQVAIVLADASSNEAVANKVRDAINDVYRMVRLNFNWGGLARWTRPVDHTIDLVEEEKTYGGGKVNIDIIFETLAFNTDTQG